MNEQSPIDQEQISLATIIDSRIWVKFINDYGVVKSIVDDGHIDVTHAVRGVLRTGEVLPPYVSTNVELLYPSSSVYAEQYPVKVGDGVLLIGLKDYVKSTLNINPQEPLDFRHYSQDTLKAIPVAAINDAVSCKLTIDDNGKWSLSAKGVEIDATTQKVAIRNAAKSLYTLLNTLEGALAVFMGSTSQAAITSGGTSSVSLAAALVALMATFSSTTATMQTDLAALMEA